MTWKGERQRHNMAAKGVKTTGKLYIPAMGIHQDTNELFDVNSAQKTIEYLSNNIEAPFVQAYYSTLGGKDKVSILIAISLDQKKDWPNKILQNSNYIKLYFASNGDIEYICGNKIGGFRKIKSKSIVEAVEKINKYINKEKRPLMPTNYQEMERKYGKNTVWDKTNLPSSGQKTSIQIIKEWNDNKVPKTKQQWKKLLNDTNYELATGYWAYDPNRVEELRNIKFYAQEKLGV